MEVVAVRFCAVFRCKTCGRVTEHELPLQPGEPVHCTCGRALPIGTDALNTIEVMKASLLSPFAH